MNIRLTDKDLEILAGVLRKAHLRAWLNSTRLPPGSRLRLDSDRRAKEIDNLINEINVQVESRPNLNGYNSDSI